ncbi:MAG: class II glutamine amidotransferase [Balneolaceae bacterium]
MCRWLAYSGEPLFIEDLVTQPTHSLVRQSLNTRMNFSPAGNLWHTNGDGFGIGWYSMKEEPGLFKDERPAWNDENLHEISSQIQARAFLAHIRAATTAEVQRTNCHPFKFKNWLFQHNGNVSDFYRIRRDLQMAIAPELFPELKGNTDSETMFLLALTYGLQKNPKEALQRVVKRIHIASRKHHTAGQLNLSLALCDGDKLYTVRYAEKEKAMSQFYSSNLRSILDLQNKGEALPIKSVVVVSEPITKLSELWEEVPENTFTTIDNGKVHIEDFME